jgi:starch synthase
MSLRLLYAAAEAQPLVKTGGLADVAGSLPAALAARGADVRLALPAYRGWRESLAGARAIARLRVHEHDFTVHEAPHPHSAVPCWLFECPPLFDRAGTPYEDERGAPWPDNGIRFGTFARAVAQFALASPGFAPDVVHANDWHLGLAPAFLREAPARPATAFTIHNLAYQGLFPREDADRLGLPPAWWHTEGIEFHGQLSHLKAGIVHADAITTVSPAYAREILEPGGGCGLDGLLRAHAARLRGIVNGIDVQAWNPATDAALAARYDAQSLAQGKAANRLALQRELGLEPSPAPLLVGMVARFAGQKGTDLLPAALPLLQGLPLQFAVLGRGEARLEHALREWAEGAPGSVALRIGHDEALAHRIFAGADVFLMPSRHEPCGLTQMYAQRYGTVPVARRTGGLADTIVDADAAALAAGSATGVLFADADAGGIAWGLARALELRADAARWRALQHAGMRRDFSWDGVAGDYLRLYEGARRSRR